jgi:hypothetical protein
LIQHVFIHSIQTSFIRRRYEIFFAAINFKVTVGFGSLGRKHIGYVASSTAVSATTANQFESL